MTHDELVARAAKWLSKRCGVVFDDRFRACTHTGEQPDAIGWRAGCSIMIECKASRSDFLADRKKKFRKDPSLGVGDWRFMMCPTDMIRPDEIPNGWGLLYAGEKKVRVVSGGPFGTGWHNPPLQGNRQVEMAMMYSALRRMQIRGHLDDIYAGVPDDNS